jgi:hypothetical protein
LHPEFAPLETIDIREIAELHRSCLPTSTLSELGVAFLRAFYRYTIRSPFEHVIVCRYEGSPVACATISFQPETLNRRLAFKTPLIWSVVCHLHKRIVRQALIQRPETQLNNSKSDSSEVPAPELIALFCRQDMRDLGIGGELIDGADKYLGSAGQLHYFVRTFDDPANSAIKFYTRHGFVSVGHILAFGQKFLLMSKKLLPPQRNGLAE